MLGLRDSACAYLTAGGFRTRSKEAGFVEMERDGDGGSLERFFVWTDEWVDVPACDSSNDPPAQNRQREEALVADVKMRMTSVPGATGYYICGKRKGLSSKFINDITAAIGDRGGIRAPIEFFDAPFKADNADARRARSLLEDLLECTKNTRRVAQPFYVRTGLEAGQKTSVGGDLVEHLETAISDLNQGPKLRIIEGSAGSGKTVAFNALVDAVYGEFVEAKRARARARRPIVFLPNHLRGSRVGYVDDVIKAVMETDVADAVRGDQLSWLMRNGFSIWMFDGLDEFCSGNGDFLKFLDDVLTAPGSQAQVIISTRDSLLSSRNELRSFVERHLNTGTSVEIYGLKPWDKDVWREVAWLEFEQGRADAKYTDRVNEFVRTIESSDNISELATLPFYCSILLERARDGEGVPEDEFEAIEYMVDKMFEREESKGVFSWQDYIDLERLTNALEQEFASRSDLPVPENVPEMVQGLLKAEGRDILLELMGAIAHNYSRDRIAGETENGLTTAEVEALSGLANIPFGLHDDAIRRLKTVMVQFAFFGPGRKAGYVDFTHQILADYLAARYAVSSLKREARENPAYGSALAGAKERRDAFKAAVEVAFGSSGVAPTSLFFRYLAREIRRDPNLRMLVQEVCEAPWLHEPQRATEFSG